MIPAVMRASAKSILVGIDEAGYGPILGPLVVSAAAFEVPTAALDDCLWQKLRRSVSNTTTARRARIAILDSKLLYRRKVGLAPLERSVLAVLAAWRGLPATMRPLLGLLCPDALGELADYPWYDGADPTLPRSADAAIVRIAGGLLASDLAEHDLRLAGCYAEVLAEGHYNRLVEKTRNKSVALFGLVLRLIHRIARAYPRHPLRIVVDKQGARSRYGPLLMRAFADRHLRIISETAEQSSYAMSAGDSSWRISFEQSGESKHLPVALASLFSKYLREILMGCFNEYWSRQVTDLKPTAGYYQDGLRFLQDIQEQVRRLKLSRDTLVRQR